MQDLFFELLQVAIGRSSSLSRVPSADEWSALHGLAQKQAVAGVCFVGVQWLAIAAVISSVNVTSNGMELKTE